MSKLTVKQQGTRGKLRVKFQFFTLHQTTSPQLAQSVNRRHHSQADRQLAPGNPLKHCLPGALLAVGSPTCTGISNLGSGLQLWVPAMGKSYLDQQVLPASLSVDRRARSPCNYFKTHFEDPCVY